MNIPETNEYQILMVKIRNFDYGSSEEFDKAIERFLFLKSRWKKGLKKHQHDSNHVAVNILLKEKYYHYASLMFPLVDKYRFVGHKQKITSEILFEMRSVYKLKIFDELGT